jgi:hypothetical protein
MISSWIQLMDQKVSYKSQAVWKWAQVETGMNLMDLEDLGESFHVPVLFVGLRLLE